MSSKILVAVVWVIGVAVVATLAYLVWDLLQSLGRLFGRLTAAAWHQRAQGVHQLVHVRHGVRR